MMDEKLLERFARIRPATVAAELEKFSMTEVLAFMDEVPMKVAGNVVAQMNSNVMVRLLDRLSGAQIAHLICNSDPQSASAIVAHLPANRYRNLLEEATPEQQDMLADLMSFPANTVGLHVVPDFLRVSGDTTCAEFRKSVGASEIFKDLPIFLVSEDSRYLGMVPVFAMLLDKNQDRLMADFAEHEPAIHADAGIRSVLGLRAWYRNLVLPVVDHNGILLGAITFEALKGLTEVDNRRREVLSPATVVVDGYLEMCADLTDALFDQRVDGTSLTRYSAEPGANPESASANETGAEKVATQ